MTVKSCGSCTKCCQAIHLPKGAISKSSFGPDADFIKANWKRISARRAKKINPHPFDAKYHGAKRTRTAKRMQFYKCVNLTPSGCGAYESRPPVCSGYPYYDREPKAFHGKDYSPDCVYIINPITLSASGSDIE